MADLSTTYMGLPLSSPVIVGSCGLTQSLESLKRCEAAGAGAVVLKSIFEEQILAESEVDPGDNPLWHSEGYEYLHDYVEENAVSRFLELIQGAKKALEIPVIASINCASPDKWLEFAGRMKKAGADGIELNINLLSGNAHITGPELEEAYFALVENVKGLKGIPVSIKIGYHFSALAAFLFRLSHSSLDGLVLFNRPFFPDFDVDKLELTTGSYLSSPREYVMPLRWISLCSSKTGCDLCASTGIHDGEAAVKMLLAGASAVQVVSTLYDNGLEQIQVINGGIRQWMDSHGHGRIGDFKGQMRQADSKNPAAYERVQFMKYSAELSGGKLE